MDFKKSADFLWPIGATVLALLGMPLAIEQYPDFFKENRWPLPISLIVVLACWIVPLFLHDRARRILKWVKSFGWIGKGFAGVIAVAILIALITGSLKLFHFHTKHLASVLLKKETKQETLVGRHEEPKPEPPRTENPPTTNRKTPAKPIEKTEPFSVSVEWAQFSIGGKENGTGFWAYYASPTTCTLAPIKAVFFIRVKNLRNTPLTVIGYSLDVSGVPLVRTNMANIVLTPQKGSIKRLNRPSGYPINIRINYGQGPGFSMVQSPLKQSDFTQASLLEMDLIENLLKVPLQPNIPIRGWAFYQSPNENAFSVAGPGHITLETDDSHTFSYEFNLRNPHPELDILERVITAKSLINVSSCKWAGGAP